METVEIDLQAVEAMAVEALRNSIKEAFLLMAGMRAVLLTEHPSDQAIPLTSVAGVIGWSGTWSGVGVLECTPEFACDLSNKMLGTDEITLTDDALDAVAEMANIVFGSMKTKLEPTLGRLGLSTPTVVYGDNLVIRGSGKKFIIVPVQIAEHALYIKLAVTKMGKTAKPFLGE